jgi:hopene-associated glycosyltransferase HpnB
VLLASLAALSLAVWIYLLFARGEFWRVDRNLIPPGTAVREASIVAVIPARDEAEHIGRTVKSLLTHSVPVRVVVVDDASADGTAEVAHAAAQQVEAAERVAVLTGKALVPGWSGKLWAVSQGIEHALAYNPDYLLLTDADIVHGRESMRDLLALAQANDYQLTSLMVKLACQSTPERLLIPAFVFFFLQLYPPVWIRDPKKKTAGAAGGCMLIRPEALARIGGIGAIRSEVIDDCALARAVKRTGGRVWLGLTDQTSSIRSYGSFSEIARMIARTAFNQLRHSVWLLIATVAGLCLTYLIPPVALLGSRSAAIFGAAAWLAMTLCYWPMIRFYRRPWISALSLPIVALFYTGATFYSAVLYWSGSGGAWKGRVQDPS